MIQLQIYDLLLQTEFTLWTKLVQVPRAPKNKWDYIALFYKGMGCFPFDQAYYVIRVLAMIF